MTQEGVPISSHRFSTESFRPHEQFDAWCAFSKGMADLEPDGPRSAGFLASSELYQLGSIFLSNYALPPMMVDYGSNVVRRSQLDHWCLAVVTRGSVAVDSDRKGFESKADDLVLYSYATPFVAKMEVAEYSSLFFSRDDFWDVADELDRASQLRVMGPLSQIIADFLLSVKDRAHMLTVTDAAAVTEAFGALVRAMVRQTPTTLEAARAPIAAIQFDRARRFIAENLKSPDLTPDMICARLGLSRRNLYYLFEKHGGVATFIKNRRLAACQHALAKSSERKLISSIAYEYGFTNATAFSRQFQARYGFRPSEVRSAYINGHNAQVAAGNTFVDWLMRV
ncbi:helix-turn-helix domain-containing protein [Mesorhizobium sp. L-8-3]|uniref:helix-turn-helix domain-containing protein n=1 Tax=Mesorhizobium sp. L-8-3 TaxID=2744522 RepID=UPI001928AE39|nr:helix-turn-helix domain-containing protein [Mesorhizobium sp. L-8-3]